MKLELTDKFRYAMTKQFPILKIAEEAIFDAMGVSIDEMRSNKRYRNFVYARMIFSNLCDDVRPHCHLATYLNRDHSMLVYWNKTFNDSIKYDKNFSAIYNDVIEIFQEKKLEYGIF